MEVFKVMAEKGIAVVHFTHDFRTGGVTVEPGEVAGLAPEQFDFISKILTERGEGHEQLTFGSLLGHKIRVIRARHDSLLGFPLGGFRWRGDYRNEREAILDTVDLAEGMSGKGYWAGTGTSGSKIVSWTDLSLKTPEALEAFGEFQTGLADNITGEDMNINPDDCTIIARKTGFIAGTREKSGVPGPKTAYGVFLSLRAAMKFLWDITSFGGMVVAIQGITGSVGSNLAEYLVEAGATVIGSYWEKEKEAYEIATRLGIRIVPGGKGNPYGIFQEGYDILSLNGTGKWLNEITIPLVPPETIIGGGANNQLDDPRDDLGDMLFEKGIWYLPDFVINPGGLINVADERGEGGYNERRVMKNIEIVEVNIPWILSRAKIQKTSPHRIADWLPRAAIKKARQEKYGVK